MNEQKKLPVMDKQAEEELHQDDDDDSPVDLWEKFGAGYAKSKTETPSSWRQ
jgi:hypothetical protein